jgi:hypothetical protein
MFERKDCHRSPVCVMIRLVLLFLAGVIFLCEGHGIEGGVSKIQVIEDIR